MVNPLDFIPKLSGFSPMPLGIMAPFMGYQSAALAYNFGLNYEFGKRVIKSMSNEKFNKIAEDPILLNELTSRHHDVLLEAFINEVPKVDKIQDLIIKKMVELEFAKIKVMPELIAQIPKGFIEGLFALGNTGEQLPNIPQPNPPPSGKGKQSPNPSPPPSIKKPPKLKVGKSTQKTTAQLINESFGKIRSGVSYGKSVSSVWSHIARTGNAYTDWAKISGSNRFSLAQAKAFGHTAWPTTTYYLKLMGGDWYYLLK